MSIVYSATYSVEDDKLRISASERLDPEMYARVKELGFRWAPLQKLFVASRWTPQRESLSIELAGEIKPEQTTLAERAEVKAARLDALADKRERESIVYADAAVKISERFQAGQPILVGHHSERKAMKDKQRMDAAMDKAEHAFKAIDYWRFRAEGVERHANKSHNPRTVANRIKALGKSFRDHQSILNHAHLCLQVWSDVAKANDDEFIAMFKHYYGVQFKSGSSIPFRWDSNAVNLSEKEARVLVDKIVLRWEAKTQSEIVGRWQHHILNRLAYERSEQGAIARYEGELTATLLQAFARDQGVMKPKATGDTERWVLTSPVPLPVHVGDGLVIEGDENHFRDLMQSIGYEVPAKKERRKSTAKNAPLINPTLEDAQALQARWNANAKAKHADKYAGEMVVNSVSQMLQEAYKARSGGSYSPCMTIELDANGERIWSNYKGKSGIPVCRIRVFSRSSGSIYAPNSIVHISDKPAKALPFEIITTEATA